MAKEMSATMFLKKFFNMEARAFMDEWRELSDQDKEEYRAMAEEEMERQGIPIK